MPDTDPPGPRDARWSRSASLAPAQESAAGAGGRLGAECQALAEAASAAGDGQDELLSALARLSGVRAGLDDIERRLIESARDHGASWAQISASLGLASRQGAEQRWLRLSSGSGRDPVRTRVQRQRQRAIDDRYGPEIAYLRNAVRAAQRRLRADPAWDERHPRAGLARASLDLAGTAEPGALFALSSKAIEDIDAVPDLALPPTLRAALDRLRGAVAAATPLGQS